MSITHTSGVQDLKTFGGWHSFRREVFHEKSQPPNDRLSHFTSILETKTALPDASLLRGFAPAISMMKSAEPRFGTYRRDRRRPTLNSPSIGRVLIEGIVSPIRVVVIHIIPNQPPQMLFVDRDDVVENLTAATSDPAFCDSVLPWRLNTRALRLQAGCLQECNHLIVEFRVVVQQDVAVWICSGKHFSQLLHDPIGSRMNW